MPKSFLLDTESEHIRETYAYFGLAVYWAQCLEQSIFQHLLFAEHFPKAVASYTSAEQWATDFDAYEASEMSQTMGKLIRRLGEAGQPIGDIQPLLEQALRKRNWLAHGYFPDRAIELTVSSGRDRMLAELEAIQELFRECCGKLDELTLPLAQRVGLSKERLADVEAELMAEFSKARPPT